MGGSAGPTPGTQTEQQILAAYSQYLPGLLKETTAGIGPAAAATANASAQSQDVTDAANLAQLQKYAMPEAQIGQQVANSNAQAGAQTNLEQIQGAGGAAATAASNLNKSLNPDYYTAQDAASKGAAAGVNAINLNGLSPGEEAATERSLAQNNVGTGNLGLLNPTNTIANAMNFGGAFNNKLGLMNNAVGAATGAANSATSNGGFNATNVALGQPNTSTAGNFGTSMMTPTTSSTSAGSAGNVFNFGSGLLGNMTSSNNAMIGANAQLGTANSIPSYLSSTCCFIFMESYHGLLPWFIREGRDRYYAVNPDIATGYRRMASWLVPIMQVSPVVQWLVWLLMVEPITQHLGFVNRVKGYKRNRLVTHFWLKLWSVAGRNHVEAEYATPWYYPERNMI